MHLAGTRHQDDDDDDGDDFDDCDNFHANCFIIGQWPQLQELDLSGKLISSAFTRVLVKGHWPVMKSLLFMDCVMAISVILFLLQRG